MSYKTILNRVESKVEIEKSVFITYTKPVINEIDAIEFIDFIRKKHYDASHNVPVYLIGKNNEIQKYSDDGEPSGTAGLPIIEMYKKEGYTNIVSVTTRYFGGTKLGKGGLVRAYTTSAKKSLEQSQILDFKFFLITNIRIDYNLIGKVEFYLKNNPIFFIVQIEYFESVLFKIALLEEDYNDFFNKLNDITNGTVIFSESEKMMASIYKNTLYTEDFYDTID
jgi:uncharacterized YigZ family protein